jgi:ABC-type methionine transport system ATPase subunit
MKDRLRLTFEKDKVADPVVCQMAKRFDLVFSIRRANVEPDAGWMDLELQGEESEVESAITWLESVGVRVTPAGGDVMAG